MYYPTHITYDLRFVYRFLNDMILRLKSETSVRIHSLIYLRLQAGTIEDKTLALQMPLAQKLILQPFQALTYFLVLVLQNCESILFKAKKPILFKCEQIKKKKIKRIEINIKFNHLLQLFKYQVQKRMYCFYNVSPYLQTISIFRISFIDINLMFLLYFSTILISSNYCWISNSKKRSNFQAHGPFLKEKSSLQCPLILFSTYDTFTM